MRYYKKALKLCSENVPQIIGDMLGCYEKLIELHCIRKNYDKALNTYDKIKLFNLNSRNVSDIDAQTPTSRTLALYWLISGKM